VNTTKTNDQREGEHVANDTSGKAQLTPSIVAAVLTALAASGVGVYLAPSAQMARDPMARPDPYTGSMHKQYAETVDARFESVFRSLNEVNRRVDECKGKIKDLRTEQHDYYQSVLASMERIYTALTHGRKE
jgi:hypothetical protein